MRCTALFFPPVALASQEEIICTNESSVLKYYCVKVYNGYEDPTTEKLSPMPIRTIFFPIWLFHTVVARGRFSLPAPAVPYNRHDTSKFTKAYTREDRRLRAGHLQVRVQIPLSTQGFCHCNAINPNKLSPIMSSWIHVGSTKTSTPCLKHGLTKSMITALIPNPNIVTTDILDYYYM
ncbi:hypothetical protein LguiA_022155 [Lonicera macranthoides]